MPLSSRWTPLLWCTFGFTLAACAPQPERGPTDADLRAAVEVALALDPVTTALELAAVPDAGVIRVVGRTESVAQQEHALQVAAAVPGVVEALDNMTLAPGALARIATEVRKALAARPDLTGVRFSVVVAEDGVVTLSSDDTDATQRQLALDTANQVESVTSVLDRMR